MARLMAEREELCFHCEFVLEFFIRERDYRSEMKMDMCVGFGSCMQNTFVVIREGERVELHIQC